MNLEKKIALMVVCLALTGVVFAQYAPIFKLPFPKQYHTVDSLFDALAKKDSIIALSDIEQIRTAARQSNNELSILNFRRLLLEYLYNQTRASSDSIVVKGPFKDFKNLLATIDEKKYTELAAKMNMTLGFIYYYRFNKYNQAFSHYIKAYNLLKSVPPGTSSDRQYSQYAIARAYYQFNDFETAIALGSENESMFPKKNYISVFNVQMIGLSYLNLKKYDSAMTCFQWVLANNMRSINPLAWKGIALGSIGDVYFFTNRYDNAISYLDSGIHYTIKTGVHDNAAVFASHLSTIYLTKDSMPLAKKYADIAYQSVFHFGAPLNDIGRYQWLLNHSLLYQLLSDYYKKIGDVKFAFLYLDSVLLLKDSLAKWHDVSLKYQGELAVEKERAKQNELLYEQEEVKNKLVRDGLICFIILAMLVTLLVYNRGRLQIKHREERLLAEKQLAEAELRNAGTQLREFTKSIVEKNALIEKVTLEMERLGEEYQQLQNRQSKALPSVVLNEDSLKLLQEAVLLTDDDWKNFTRLFEKVHEGFFYRLKEKLPGLSPAETRFVALSKLKLNNKEMAAMLGVSTDAIRQSRSRLKKKLHFTEDIGIEEAVEKI